MSPVSWPHASIDYGQSTKFETHVELLSHNVQVFENLADINQLPDRGFEIMALPMKISGGTGDRSASSPLSFGPARGFRLASGNTIMYTS
jgi:hypothetical protein